MSLLQRVSSEHADRRTGRSAAARAGARGGQVERRGPNRPKFVQSWHKTITPQASEAEAPQAQQLDHIDIWLAHPDSLLRAHSSLRVLTPEDWTTFDRIGDSSTRHCAVASRILLRLGLSRAAGHQIAPGAWRFKTVAHGKPAVADNLPDLKFSVSHTDRLAAVAISPHLAVGIDVEGVGKWSVDGWMGAMIAPWSDLDTSGARVWISAGAGGYKYAAQGTLFRGLYETGEMLAGYGFEGNTYSINVLAGLNAINDMVTPFDPDNKVQGTQGGLKVRMDAYTTPTSTTMTYGEAEYSTAFSTFYLSQKFGFDITNSSADSENKIYVGPMASFLGDLRFTQWRVGAHISNLKLGKLDVDLAAGYADDSVVGTGAFSTVELSSKF